MGEHILFVCSMPTIWVFDNIEKSIVCIMGKIASKSFVIP